ncbi:MAG TPA: CTP synthase [bacterium]|nr:CTP synthase [bacterium]
MSKKSSRKLSPKFIFVVGGVMSGVGKGVAVASIGRILTSQGFDVTALKIDPYINVDAGTMNPIEHGEVFVTEDGDETDQDIGNYERFLNKNIYRENYMTTGRVYQAVIERERNLGYGGKCVEVVPHIPLEVKARIENALKKSGSEIMIVEIGGTVGEYQNMLFLEAARMMKFTYGHDVVFVMVSYLPIPSNSSEMKTKPTQYAIRTLNTAGIQPDFIIARSATALDLPRREKIATNCNISPEDVISAPDSESIYDVPINFEKDHLGERILRKFNLKPRRQDMVEWKAIINRLKTAKKSVDIAIVGKYFMSGDFHLTDSYISVLEAVKHAAAANRCKVNIHWLSAEEIEQKGTAVLKNFTGIIVPQGWGSRGSEGKIKTIKYCRENKVPYLGLCYGMQMAVIEFARNVAGLKGAHSAEANPKTKYPVIDVMEAQKDNLAAGKYGGTIRLGGWPCKLVPGTQLAKIYAKKADKKGIVSERHRHRYEFNPEYRELLEKKGLVIAGTSPDNTIVEAIELKNHPFFIGTQFHPEYISRPLDPHPLFVEFVKVCSWLKSKEKNSN